MVERDGVKIYRGDYIAESAKIGYGTKIGAGHDIGKYVVIGRNCNIQCHVSISDNWRICDEVFIGPGVKFANDKYMNGTINAGIVFSGARIGMGSKIGAGVHIGENARIGQGSNVIKDIPANVWAFGNPARVIRPLTEEELKQKPFWIKFPILGDKKDE